jgi:hypothetical protein
MARKIIARYRTKRDGIVEITQEDGHDWSPTGSCFDAWWSYNFMISLRLGEGSAFSTYLDKTMEWVRKWDPCIELFEDFDQYPMFARDENDGTISVSLEAEHGCVRPVLAKDVPPGSFLVNDALNFFRWHKGKDAVEDRKLVK